MSWKQVLVVSIVNVVTIASSIGFIRWQQNRQKKKLVESFVKQIENKIQEEVSFSELVKDFYQSDMRDMEE